MWGVAVAVPYILWKIGNGSGIIRHIAVEFKMIDGRNIDPKFPTQNYTLLSKL